MPARVSFVAYPGGSIFVDGRFVGRDETSVMRLSAGEHVVRVENAFLRSHEARITLSPDQRGTIVIEW